MVTVGVLGRRGKPAGLNNFRKSGVAFFFFFTGKSSSSPLRDIGRPLAAYYLFAASVLLASSSQQRIPRPAERMSLTYGANCTLKQEPLVSIPTGTLVFEVSATLGIGVTSGQCRGR